MATIERRETADGKARWWMRVHVGRDPNGKQRFVVKRFDRKGDAEQEARRLERMRDKGSLVEPSRITLNQYLEHWLKVKEGEVRARTAYNYRHLANRYVIKAPAGAPAIGIVRLDRLRPEAFEELYAWMREKLSLSPRTIQHVHVMLHGALEDAARKGTVSRNPTQYAKRPKRAKADDDELEERAAMRAMDQDQADRFIDAARPDRYYALWCILLTGGLRPEEVLGLKWPSVNLNDGKVHIERVLTRVGVKGWKLVPPKTAKARRVIALSQVAAHALRDWRRRQLEERILLGAEYQDQGFVFANPFGKPLHGANLSRRNFRGICEHAGLGEHGPAPAKRKGQPGPPKKRPFKPAFRMYDLRHTCATLLLQQGVNVKVVSELLGHASVRITLDIYSHVLPDMQDTAVAAMDAMFGGPPGFTGGSQPQPKGAKTGNKPNG